MRSKQRDEKDVKEKKAREKEKAKRAKEKEKAKQKKQRGKEKKRKDAECEGPKKAHLALAGAAAALVAAIGIKKLRGRSSDSPVVDRSAADAVAEGTADTEANGDGEAGESGGDEDA